MIVVDTNVKPTLKAAMEGCFPITSANDESTGDYVVIDTDVRSTQKALMQEEFDLANAAAENVGEWIDFQGSVNPTKRQFFKILGVTSGGIYGDCLVSVVGCSGLSQCGNRVRERYHPEEHESEYYSKSDIPDVLPSPSLHVASSLSDSHKP